MSPSFDALNALGGSQRTEDLGRKSSSAEWVVGRLAFSDGARAAASGPPLSGF